MKISFDIRNGLDRMQMRKTTTNFCSPNKCGQKIKTISVIMDKVGPFACHYSGGGGRTFEDTS